ncbi:MAG: hypothetical protein IT422_09175 [Pirellulaceae bacterium]|nr:hypothetical protein [Pirellulaceae bacterium]
MSQTKMSRPNVTQPNDLQLGAQHADQVRQVDQPPVVLAHVASGRQASFLEKFIDSFFHENNIRWMLVIGAAIVFASSLMLVTHEWSSWSVSIRYLTIVAYTLATYAFSEFARRRLGLQTTARVMQVLTLLLLPIPFLSLQWLGSATWMGVAESALHAVLLILPTAGLTWIVSQRIFENLLRGRQRTFHISYCLLCVAGAMPALYRVSSIDESLLSWLAAAVSAGLWLVMSIGVVKVNRHVFWLAEEHRLPRIFGFFPIALLGGQFLLLLACKTAWSIHVEWLGLGCVMLATTIFATGRAVAQVFKRRTGDLVRPLPWPIVLPIFVALATLALGVGVSFVGFSITGPTTYAVVPTALVAAAVLLWAAYETRHAGFVWCGLILFAVAYQCAPTLMADLVASLKSTAAAAVSEERLPIAFYGLTYLPLLSLFAIASRFMADRERTEFSRPLQTFVTGMSLALLGLSLTHLKASLPVAAISVASFTAMAVLFRDRRYIIGSIVALIIATITFVPVVNAMHWAVLPERHILLALSALVGLITLVGPLDRWLLRIPLPAETEHFGLVGPDGEPRKVLQLCVVFLGYALSVVWVAVSLAYILTRDPQWNVNFAGGVLMASLALQTVRTKRYVMGLNLSIPAAIAGLIELIQFGGSTLTIISSMSIAAAVLAIISWSVLSRLRLRHWSLALSANTSTRLAEALSPQGSQMQMVGAFVGPLCDVSLMVTLCLATVIHLPLILVANVALSPLVIPVAISMVVVACIAMAGVLRFRSLVAFSVVVLPLWLSSLVVSLAPAYATYALLPLIWSVSLAGTLALGQRLIGDGFDNAVADLKQRDELGTTSSYLSAAGLLTILYGSVFYLDVYTLAAAVIAAAMLWYVNRRRLVVDLAGLAIIAHVLSFYLVEIALGNRGWVFGIDAQQWLSSVPFLMPLIVMGVALFDVPWARFSRTIADSWIVGMRVLFVGGAVVSLMPGTWQPLEFGLFVASMLGMATVELRIAVRRQVVANLWTGVASAVLAVVFLAAQGVVVVGMAAGQLALLSVAIVALALSRRITNHPHFGFAAQTCQQIGLAIPGCVVLLRMFASVFGGIGPTELGPQAALNTIVMLAAAGIYFYHGTAARQRQFVILALAIFNLALALAWHSLQWYDLQLYLVPLGVSVIALVELLRREIPANAHDSLRYVGALTILVSPMLEILGGSWWHLLSLLVLCVCIVLASIGLRLRALVFTGSAFLLVDLVAMVIHSSFDHPQLLWITGLAIGGGVIALAAICENQRERLLDRIRLISAELATWH